MEDRVARLEARLEAVEKELGELRSKMGMEPSKPAPGDFSGDEQAFLDACPGISGSDGVVVIKDARKALGWETARFDEALARLSENGGIVLKDSGGGLSLRQMEDSFWGDDGKSYTEFSLA